MVPSHQKPPIFASIFHQIFMFFPNPLPEAIFRGSKSQPILKSAILEPYWIQGGSKNRSPERHFRPKRLQKPSPPNNGERPGADLVAIWRRKRSKDAFLSIWLCFLLILEGFWTNFGWILKDFTPILDVVFVRIQASILQDFFSKTVKP